MMKQQKFNRYHTVLWILSAALILSLLLGSAFAVLYIRSAVREALPAGGRTEEQDNTAELALLADENERLRQKIRALEEASAGADETEPVPETEPAEDEPHIPVDAPSIGGSFDAGDLMPAPPESLSYTLDLTKQLSMLRTLETEMVRSPFIVTPEGELMLFEELEFDEDTEILYREVEGTAYDADGMPLLREIDYEAMGYQFPTVSVCYRDMERGTTYSYRGDEVFFSASLIKAPYIYTLLEQIAVYNDIKKANPTNDPAVGTVLPEEILEKYDLERKIHLTENRKAEGSGVIRDMDLSGGMDFTVLQLIEYAIRVSDNTAFRVLRDEFGYDYFWTVSRRLGVNSVFTSFNNLTTEDAVRYLTAMYDFAKEHPFEGGILISLMKQANHAVMLPAALKGKAVAHKYGWDHDSYHDMALVYGDAPYAVCIMTNFNFDENDDTINDYIKQLAVEIDALHESFYEKKE